MGKQQQKGGKTGSVEKDRSETGFFIRAYKASLLAIFHPLCQKDVPPRDFYSKRTAYSF